MKDKKYIVITGGGTGGHIFPAISVAKKLLEESWVDKILYIGCPDSMEENLAHKENLNFFNVKATGMPRKKSIELVLWGFNLVFSILKVCIEFIKKRPNLVFGTGGYASSPALFSAILLNIPIVIHDPDAQPGIVSKTIAPYAKSVSISYEQAKKHLKNKNIILNGNPLRKEFLEKNSVKNNRKTLLAIGGSQGARSINTAILGAVKMLTETYNLTVIHQVGKKNFEEFTKEMEEKYPEHKNNENYTAEPFYNNMPELMKSADIAISRAGSLSISELNISELPSILVPYPYAAADHQRFNAKAMEKQGASIYLEDNECSAEKILGIIDILIKDEEKLKAMKQANSTLAKPNALSDIVKLIENNC